MRGYNNKFQNNNFQPIEIEDPFRKINNLEWQLSQKDSLIKDLQNELDNEKKKSNKYYNLYISYKKEKEELFQKLKVIEQNNNISEEKIKELNNLIDKFKGEVQEKTVNIKNLNFDNKGLKEKILVLEKDKNNLTKKINGQEKSYLQISKENQLNQKSLKEKELSLLNITKQVNSLNEEKNNIETKNKKTITELQNKIKELQEDLNKNKNELNKFNGVIKHFNNVDNQLEQLSKYKEENIKLIEENKTLEKALNIGETKEEYLITPAEEFYDVIIDIKSIRSLKKEGWAILYNEKRKETYEKIIGEETMKIGVLGLNNVGKSYLLTKIAIPDLPSGHSIETKGISIKYADPKDNNDEEIKGICILDSAGFETPLLEEEKIEVNKDNIKNEQNPKNKEYDLENAIKFDEIEDELARDKAQTERFIEQLIISLSDMLILVIGKLTRTEQR